MVPINGIERIKVLKQQLTSYQDSLMVVFEELKKPITEPITDLRNSPQPKEKPIEYEAPAKVRPEM